MKGFILTRHWRDTASGIQLEFWLASESGPVRLIIKNQQAVCFFRKSDLGLIKDLVSAVPLVKYKSVQLKNYHGESVMALYFQKQRQLREIHQVCKNNNIILWETDIKPPERFLMERFITSSVIAHGDLKKSQQNYISIESSKIETTDFSPNLSLVSLDIETSLDAKQLYSIAIYSKEVSMVFMVDEGLQGKHLREEKTDFVYCIYHDERSCLKGFMQWFQEFDPDIIIGWYVVQFDLWVLENLCQNLGLAFTLGRAKQKLHWRNDGDTANGRQARQYLQVPGRVVLDGIELLRTAFYSFESFTLQAVAKELLGEGKLLEGSDRGLAISDLYKEDKLALAAYNLQDSKLVWDIFEKTKLIDFAIERSRLTGLDMDRMGGSVASFDYAYLPRLHRFGYVAPNLGELESRIVSPGGYVMRSKPGIYKNVIVLDFKSLYPSIIRTFSIDPYAFWIAEHKDIPETLTTPGFNGARFAKEQSILPGLISQLWKERDQAKLNNNKPLSQAIKIIMNSFYGVLGSQGCRFYDPRVCSSITLRGHEIMQRSRDWIVSKGYDVIYGDTDSLFIAVEGGESELTPENVGLLLAEELNEWWCQILRDELDINSALEIEFETHYSHFLMPTIRGSEEGSKKRYAGIINLSVNGKEQEQLVFKGLETVRTDWTVLAKDFQKSLYYKVFKKEAYSNDILETIEGLLSGVLDESLVYKKKLRRDLIDYQKNNPPHVKAARRLAELSGKTLGRGDTIYYVVTVNGPEPVECRQSRIDYQHYLDKQLQPVADSILSFIGDRFENYCNRQFALI